MEISRKICEQVAMSPTRPNGSVIIATPPCPAFINAAVNVRSCDQSNGPADESCEPKRVRSVEVADGKSATIRKISENGTVKAKSTMTLAGRRSVVCLSRRVKLQRLERQPKINNKLLLNACINVNAAHLEELGDAWKHR